MSEEKKLTLTDVVELENALGGQPRQHYDFRRLFTVVVLHWPWFIASLLACLLAAVVFLRYATPTYKIKAKILVKGDERNKGGNQKNPYDMEDFGFIVNSAGVDNEVEVLQSSILAEDAVRRLKLYTEYHVESNVVRRLRYRTQPVEVDMSPAALDSLNASLLTCVRILHLELRLQDDGRIRVDGCVENDGERGGPFAKVVRRLPASFETEVGVVTMRQNPAYQPSPDDKFQRGLTLYADVRPPLLVARSYLDRLTALPTSQQTSIAELTLRDENERRGIDFIETLVRCYNDQANADKNEIALKTEEFINGRIKKIDAELGSTESSLEDYKRRNAVTSLSVDASQSLQMSNQYSSLLSEAQSQLQLLDYLREYVNNPANQYKIIPSNIGMNDNASAQLIVSYNQTVQDRNRLLQSASEQSPQVQALTATLDDLQQSIRQALMQARRTADIQRNSAQQQLSKYQGRIGSNPVQERVLTQIGRQQEVKSELYLTLLEKREENSIALAATADKGRLIDKPVSLGRVSPNTVAVWLVALLLGLGLPFVVLLLERFLSYRLEGRDDLEDLTQLPIVADVPVASEQAKTNAGIVVQANRNTQMDEVFRSLRTNIQFMLKEKEQVILFTSSTSGEGKTFLAANLAVSFALLGKRVVLCGLDIRKPALGRLFGIADRQQGITNLLVHDHVTDNEVRGQLSPSEVNDNLDLLLAGPIPPNPTELLARQSLEQVLSHLRNTYDYVILDTAPVGLVADTLQLSQYADVSCFVTRADFTPKTNVSLLNSLAEEHKLKNPCVVLNGIDMSKKKYGYYYGYGSYGRYGRYGHRQGYGSYAYGNYGRYAESPYGDKEDNSIKK